MKRYRQGLRRRRLNPGRKQIAPATETPASEKRLVKMVAAQPDAAVEPDLLIARLTRTEQLLEAAMKRLELVEHLQPAVDAIRTQVNDLHVMVAEDLLSFEKSLGSQAAQIVSARTAIAQTDDLVDRLVEMVDSLEHRALKAS